MTIMDVPVPADLLTGQSHLAAATTTGPGHPGGHAPSWHHHLGPGYIATGYEDNGELAFPHRTAVYDAMRKTDGKIGGLLLAMFGPILATGWTLDTTGVRPEVAKFVESELGLGQYALRPARRGGFRWTEHLADALLAIPLGFMPFYTRFQVGPLRPDQQGIAGLPRTVAHLHSLEVRQPRTIHEVRVHRDGSLAGILQNGVGFDTTLQTDGIRIIGGPGMDDTTETWIDAKDLTYYCFRREGADWTGSSILRSAYKYWLLKDDALRTDAMAGERSGMGLPVVTYSQEGDKAEALSIAQNVRVGAYAGVALEEGKYRLELLGVQGTVKDLLPSIEYYDRAIGESALAQVLDLGHEAGLGGNSSGVAETFKDLFTNSLRATADWAGLTASDGFIRDLVQFNFGPDEPWPILVPDEITAESTPTASALSTLAQHGLITPDEDLEGDLRRRYGLPEKPAGTYVPPTVAEQPAEDVSPETLAPQATEDGAEGLKQITGGSDASALVARATALLSTALALQGVTVDA